MRYEVNDCKKYFCKNYYGQCRWNRQSPIVENEVYCEDFQHIDDIDYDNKIE
jgi:hypothetical protein